MFRQHAAGEYNDNGKRSNYNVNEKTRVDGCSLQAVSYTHLDVYKRQVYTLHPII